MKTALYLTSNQSQHVSEGSQPQLGAFAKSNLAWEKFEVGSHRQSWTDPTAVFCPKPQRTAFRSPLLGALLVLDVVEEVPHTLLQGPQPPHLLLSGLQVLGQCLYLPHSLLTTLLQLHHTRRSVSHHHFMILLAGHSVTTQRLPLEVAHS